MHTLWRSKILRYREVITAGLDPANLPPEYLVVADDLFDFEPPANAGHGGQPTLWLRSATFTQISEEVPGLTASQGFPLSQDVRRGSPRGTECEVNDNVET